MNTENTKLLDLQTGKYLELGKDWGYFGKFILLNLGSAIELNIKEWGSVSYGDNAYGWHGYIGQEIKQPHTDPIINEIADRLGAVIYGGRYVLLTSDDSWYYANNVRKLGDMIKFNCAMQSCFVRIISKDGIDFDTNKFVATPVEYYLGNIFEECSKQLRNEPNKFEEFKQLIK